MLKMTLGGEYFDEYQNKFIVLDQKPFTFEYSLKAIFDWEGIYLEPFLHTKLDGEKTNTLIKSMCHQEITDEYISPAVVDEIQRYIQSEQTATVVAKAQGATKRQIITSEVIYANMAELGLDPAFYEQWNFNRLITVISVTSSNRAPKKKMTRSEIYDQQRRINEERKKKMNTKG